MRVELFRRLGAGTLTALVTLTTWGCTGAGSPAAPDAAIGGAQDVTSDATFCIDEVNRLRASAGKSALNKSDRVKGFSDEAARIDGEAHEVHKHFRDTNGGGGAAKAENEIPWWKLSRYGSVRTIIREGLANEWAEGPGGGHYENITGPYGEVACGISVTNDEVTVTQDFR
jgi:hypothetical protein